VLDLSVSTSGTSATANWALPEDLEIVAVSLWVPAGQYPVDRPESGDQLYFSIQSGAGTPGEERGYRASFLEVPSVDRFMTSYTARSLTTRQGARFEITARDLASCPGSLGSYTWSEEFDISVEPDGWGPIVDMTMAPPAVASRGETVTVAFRVRDLSGVVINDNAFSIGDIYWVSSQGERMGIGTNEDFSVQSSLTGSPTDKTATYTFVLPTSPEFPCGTWKFYFWAFDTQTDAYGVGNDTYLRITSGLYVRCS